MVRRRLILSLEMQEARPNWKKVFQELSFPISYEGDEIQIDERELAKNLSGLVSMFESWCATKKIRLTYKPIEK